MKKEIVTLMFVASAVVLAAADVHAFSSKSSRGNGSQASVTNSSNSNSNNVNASVPEPSTLYAIGTGLALLGGAGWYIRRRK